MSDIRKVTGVTVEGHNFEMIVTYGPGAPDGAHPISILGVYGANDDGEDGPGTFRIELADDGVYYREGEAIGRKQAWDLVPWVISDGEILKTTAV